MLKTIRETVLHFSRQELAFRGHDESNESLNRGNYRELHRGRGRSLSGGG